MTDTTIHTVLFDLDGTLTDPKEGICKSYQYALRHYGRQADDLDAFVPLIGPPLQACFVEHLGFAPEQLDEVVAVFRDYFGTRGLYENRVYDGIVDLLAALQARGQRLALATSKAEFFAVKIMEHFGLSRYFDVMVGSELDGHRVAKADVIAEALRRLELTNGRGVAMVGDREHDVMGAQANGLRSVGVLYGYGDRAELAAAGADDIIATVGDLRALLLG